MRRILRHPTIRWIHQTLRADRDHRVAEEVFIVRLRLELGHLAGSGLDTAINWARQAEIFAFDDDTSKLYLEPE